MTLRLPRGSRRAPSGCQPATLARQLLELYCSALSHHEPVLISLCSANIPGLSEMFLEHIEPPLRQPTVTQEPLHPSGESADSCQNTA